MGAPARHRGRTPALDPGITRLRAERGSGGLYRLVTATLATATGPAYWVDGANEAAPDALFRATDDDLAVERLRIARAFTAYQHHSLVDRLADRVGPETSLVVASSLPVLYGDDDLLAGEGAALLRSSLKTLLALRECHDLAVLVTHAPDADDDIDGLHGACADRDVAAVEVEEGVRFVPADGGGTATYPVRPGRGAQATLAAFAGDADESDDRHPVRDRRPARDTEPARVEG